ncbi:cell division cycle 7-related protein kinase-like [Trichoplusia ni]|uniref:non-specific serine/threonine protein kinase n=1 Tax=Trichoplusia ni TaxID=7111 RepID=A0A7E5VIC4_TRINI|nr:cell division cycle 7-related protein kinase-like [Trichoplusia ni]
MSRIRGIEVKVQKEVLQTRKYGLNEILKKKNEDQSTNSKDDVEKHQIKELLHKLPRLDKIFEVHRKIGEGTFSSVYLGSLRQHANLPESEKRWFAIKHLVPTAHPARIEHELRCLQDIGGKDHVIGVELCLRNLDTIVFIMPYIPHRKFSEYVGEMDASELRQYMRALMVALRHVHSFGVIHRDVKPSNFLYDRDTRRYLLVDFGLAQRLCPAPEEPPAASDPPPAHTNGVRKRTREEIEASSVAKRVALDLSTGAPVAAPAGAGAGRAPRAGTQGFRPPEVLLKYPHQTTAVDVWAAGVVLASALTARYPFFRAGDDVAALAELADLLGTEPLQRAAESLGRRVVTSSARRGLCLRKLAARLRGEAPPPAAAPPPPSAAAPPISAAVAPPACARCRLPRDQCLCRDEFKKAEEFESCRCVAGFPDAAFALAARLLDPNPRSRISAADALAHPFLADHD